MKRPIVWCAAAFVCGVFIKLNFSVIMLIIVALCIVTTAYTYKSFSYLALFFVFLLGVVPITVYNTAHLSSVTTLPEDAVPVTFYVTDRLEGRSSGGFLRYSVKTYDINKEEIRANGIIYSAAKLSEFDIVKGEATIYPLLSNESDPLSYKTRLINQGYSFTAFFTTGEITGKAQPSLIDKILTLRDAVTSRIGKYASSKSYGFLSAVLTGDKTHLSSFRNKTFQKIGISHLMAVSGFHVSTLLGFLMLILKSLRVKALIRCSICTVFLLFLLPFMGFSPSAARAVIMYILFLWSGQLWKDNDSLSSLSFAAIVILVFRPYSLLDMSFVLSFLASLGLILISPGIQQFFLKYTGSRMEAVSAVLSVFVFLIPIYIYYFGESSPLSIVSNLVFVPLFSFVMFLLIITVALSEILIFMPFVLNFVTEFFLDGAEGLSRMPFSSYDIHIPDTGIYFLIITASLACAFKNKLRWMFVFLSLVIAVNTGINIHKFQNAEKLLLVSQGGIYAAVVSTPEGTVAAAECGEDASEFDYVNLSATLKENGIKSIDIFCILNYNKNTENFKARLKEDFSPEFVNSYHGRKGGLNIVFSKERLSILGILDISQNPAEDTFITGEISVPEVKIILDSSQTLNFKNNMLEFLISGNAVNRVKINQKGF